MGNDKITEVPRPVLRGGRAGSHRAIYASLVATARSGKAIRIPINGNNPHSFQGALRAWLNRHGYALHCQVSPDYLVAWAEKREPADA